MVDEKKYKILIVDDDSDVIFSVVEGLKSITKNYEFTQVLGGKEAIKKIKSQVFDVVLLDIMMPDVDGWTVAAAIKENKNAAETKIIFLTAKTDDMSKGMGSLTAQDYIIKPFELNDLKKRIDSALKK